MGDGDAASQAGAVALPGQAALELAQDYAAEAMSPATKRAYRADWADFCQWCRVQQLSALPAAPGTVAAYLAAHAATHSRSTLTRRLARHRPGAQARGA